MKVVTLSILFAGTVAMAADAPLSKAERQAAKTPKDDPYLSSTHALPPDVKPDPFHNLDAVRSSFWTDFPPALAKEYFGDSAAQRVIYRDTVTGAEVWIMARSPASEGIAYTNYFPFNADGSLIRLWGVRALMRSDGSGMKLFKELIPGEWVGLPEWSKKDPDIVICSMANGGRFEFNVKTGQRRDIFIPDSSIPPGTEIQFSDDGQHSLFVSKQGSGGKLTLELGDANGQNRRGVIIKSTSKTPESDRIGTADFRRDQTGKLYLRYSLNKGDRPAENPYQNWLVDLDGSNYRPMDSQCNMLDGPPLRFVPAGSFIVTGHGAYSPSMKYFSHHSGTPNHKFLRSLATGEQRDIAKIPGCDHMDWTIDDNWFFVWSYQPGTPIYKAYVDTGAVERIVATNSCGHNYASCPYHGTSPDGTKLVYNASMLGNLDVYMAIVKYPSPPTRVTLRRENGSVLLAWSAPERAKEITGYHVYRSDRSGGGYNRLTTSPIAGNNYRDEASPAKAFYVLTSVERSGLESRVFSNEAALSWDGPVSVYWEAEDGKLTYPMREIFLPAECSANLGIARAVRDPEWQPVTGAGQAAWSVAVPVAGGYFLWARTRNRSGQPPTADFSVNGHPAGKLVPQGNSWNWTRIGDAALKLEAGTQNVELCTADSSLELDKFLLTTDAALTPQGMGNTPSTPPATPTDLVVKWDASDKCVLLNWQASPSIGVHHYQVYRGQTAAFAPAQRALLGSPTRSAFIDPTPPEGGELYYRIVAVDNWGNASAPSDAAVVKAHAVAQPASALLEMKDATVDGGARLIDDKNSPGGKAVAFGEKATVENAGTITIPVNVPPGEYYLWLRVKGLKEKNTAFFWIQLGDTEEHYCRTTVSSWAYDLPWTWQRMEFVKSVADPQNRIMTYKITKQPATLTIRHKANYMAVDSAFVATSLKAFPPGGDEVHPGCDGVFQRRQGQ